MFLIDLILFFFSGYCLKIVNILIYLAKYSEIMSWTMKQKIFCVKTYYETKSFKQDRVYQSNPLAIAVL